MRVRILLTTTALVAACSQVPKLPDAPQVAAPMGIDYSKSSYVVQVGDELDIRLMLNTELNETVTVRPDGHISTYVVPDALAAGLTVPDLVAQLRHGYSKQLQNPVLSVEIKSSQPTRIYVAGEVNTPGEFINIGLPLTLSQAVARAGGAKPGADDANVFIIRRTASGAPEFLATHYSEVMHARNTADVSLAPYDVVVVPRTGISEFYQKYWQQYVEQFVHPSFGFSYLVNPVVGGTSIVTAPTVAR